MTRSACAVLVLLAACGLEEEREESVSVDVAAVQCLNPLGCTGNSDLIAALGTFELSMNLLDVSSRGFSVVGVTKTGQDLTSSFHVEGTSPHALYDVGGGVLVDISGPNLAGTIIHVHHKSGMNFELKFGSIMTVPFYVPAVGPPMMGYQIWYRNPAGLGGRHDSWHDLCPYATLEGNQLSTAALFWSGHRYDPDTAKIYASGPAVGTWFNISCGGEAFIKAFRTNVCLPVNAGSTDDECQAAVSMFTAKYCPGPRRYTQLGVPLEWDDTSEPHPMGEIENYEAVWGSDRAICLRNPRLVPRKEVEADCNVPLCTSDQINNWEDYGFLRSGNPPPEP